MSELDRAIHPHHVDSTNLDARQDPRACGGYYQMAAERTLSRGVERRLGRGGGAFGDGGSRWGWCGDFIVNRREDAEEVARGARRGGCQPPEAWAGGREEGVGVGQRETRGDSEEPHPRAWGEMRGELFGGFGVGGEFLFAE